LRKFRLDNGTTAGRVSGVDSLRSVGHLSFFGPVIKASVAQTVRIEMPAFTHRKWARSRNMFAEFECVCNGL